MNTSGHLSIAFLPLDTLSNEQGISYIALGLIDELVDVFSTFEGIHVLSKHPSRIIKESDWSHQEIKKQFSLDYLMEGSIKSQKDQIVIQVGLVDLETGFKVWNEKFVGAKENSLDLQIDIARSIFKKFTVSSQSLISLSETVDKKAYNLYLKALFHFKSYTNEHLLKAEKLLLQCLTISPEFAKGHALLSSVYGVLGGFSDTKYYSKSKEYALEALRINPNEIEAQLSLSGNLLVYDWDFRSAKSLLQKGIRSSPRHPELRRIYGFYFLMQGNIQSAIYEHELATKHDPYNPILINGLGLMKYFAERLDEAREEFFRTLKIDPQFRPAHEKLGWTYALEEDWEKATEHFQLYHEMTGKEDHGLTGLGYVQGMMGNHDAAYAILEKLSARKWKKKEVNLNLDFAFLYLALGKKQEAVDYLNKSIYSYEIPGVLYGVADPIFKSLWQEPLLKSTLEDVCYSQTPSEINDDGDALITLAAPSGHKLNIIARQLLYIEAYDNYCKIVWKNGKAEDSNIMRITISQIQEQINDDLIVRSQRSFIANLRFFNEIEGAGKYFLHSHSVPTKIPVSRNKVKEIKALLKDF
ncbi:MAG: LytTR family transcriptional regulator DNA-binding domain-containing protein [Cyclobacteriaceae bacterium]